MRTTRSGATVYTPYTHWHTVDHGTLRVEYGGKRFKTAESRQDFAAEFFSTVVGMRGIVKIPHKSTLFCTFSHFPRIRFNYQHAQRGLYTTCFVQLISKSHFLLLTDLFCPHISTKSPDLSKKITLYCLTLYTL